MLNYKPKWEEEYAKVAREGGHLEFFERFVDATAVSSLVIISPWIQTLNGEQITLEDIMRKIERDGIETTVIMRDPRRESMNYRANDLFKNCQHVTLYYNNDLHAKVYVCKCDPFGFALLSSANMSGHATRALEIGLLIEGKGVGCDIVDELDMLGKEDVPNMELTRRPPSVA